MNRISGNSRAVRTFAVALGLTLGVGQVSVPLLCAQMATAQSAPVLGTGILPMDQVEKLLPPSVFFKGQTAPVQLRNAAAFRRTDGTVLWVALVDTSGYSTGVREKYQMYLVTESALAFGNTTLDAGAYGAGFLSDGKAVVLDLGGHEIRHVSLETDSALRRPRPLQLLTDGGSLRLYLGKQYVTLSLK